MKKTSKSRLKKPKQGRSKALVEAIFEATVRILPKVGSRGITTKKIADLAGVSIGSLYQYFPNKESVLSAVMDTVMKGKFAEFQKKIDEVSDKSIEESTNAIVDFTLDLFLAEKEKVREIFMLAPELGKVPGILKLRQSVVERFSEEMKKHHPGRTREEYLRVSFIAVNSVMGVVQTMLYDVNQNYSVHELSAELKVMLNAYFSKKSTLSVDPRVSQ
jgi:AcrR family transcriptional regulator